jgi:hypothetical protein
MGNAEIAQRVDDGIGDDVERRGNATFAATMIGRYIRGSGWGRRSSPLLPRWC